jgi:hypothetical protein
MNSLLAVSWAMPPLVYPRAIQVSRTLTELSRRGWSIDVIALHPLSENSGKRDEELAARCNGLYRLHLIDTNSAISAEKRWWNSHLFLHEMLPADAEGRAWTKLASRKGKALINTNMPRSLVTFAQPWSDHLIGMALKRRFPLLRWIAHFSDPWVDSPYIQNEAPRVMDRWRVQEREVIRNADAVLFVTKRTEKLVMSKYPPEWRRKVRIVPHGFDQDLPTPFLKSKPTAKRLKFVHTGSLFEGLRDPLVLLEAIALLNHKIAPELMPTFEFVGSKDIRYSARACELGIDNIIKFDERTSYLDSLQIASGADVLIVIDTNVPGSVFLPSKVVDYLMFGKPILALTADDSETADALRPLGHVCVNAKEPAVVAAAIARLVKDREQVASTVQARRHLTDAYRISDTTRLLEAAIVGAGERSPPIA